MREALVMKFETLDPKALDPRMQNLKYGGHRHGLAKPRPTNTLHSACRRLLLPPRIKVGLLFCWAYCLIPLQ